ncbi:MAG TPA: hypothetical protein VFA16_20525 [Mycobacterium sp.]|uniref:hypothetical protein n=1 Tax=Mycobacterium sp. TaxID=1785 RepID=UPI002D361165|nr:hypothetical protein [Mycobacterium sp.]HZU49616.1 hypothetical protein [Mycobacterium sp.]
MRQRFSSAVKASTSEGRGCGSSNGGSPHQTRAHNTDVIKSTPVDIAATDVT